MNPPPPPARDSLIFHWATRISDYLRSLRFTSGPGIQIQHTTTGVTISSTSTPTPAPQRQLEISLHSSGTLRIRPGIIAAQPVEASGFAGWFDDDNPKLVSFSGNSSVYVKVEFNEEALKNVESIEILADKIKCPDDDPKNHLYYAEIGKVFAPPGKPPNVIQIIYGPLPVVFYRNWWEAPEDGEDLSPVHAAFY